MSQILKLGQLGDRPKHIWHPYKSAGLPVIGCQQGFICQSSQYYVLRRLPAFSGMFIFEGLLANCVERRFICNCRLMLFYEIVGLSGVGSGLGMNCGGVEPSSASSPLRLKGGLAETK